MERLDDGVFRALLDRAIGPERAAKAYPAFFTAPTTAIRLNPFKPASAGTPPEEHFPKVTCDEGGVPAGAGDLGWDEFIGKESRALVFREGSEGAILV